MPLKFRDLQKILKDFGYKLEHQRGSHQTYFCNNQSITIPKHNELKSGTAHSILSDIADHQGLSIKDLKIKYNIKL